ncbi:hypothetical protein SISNIDRAFT_471355 [Sistotremastrum niveocremeum HHB9708]|uniref:Secreted protein n=1 Tax=Sistotremastrum niveocremeum HHB9708 TaxID=1314777 RepID=A0A164MRY2_9AGAM|nr:hypothetical protein SISNIDRAFT_471355 [Sistotremastrum niveocremeum HHB9708]
MFLSWILFCTCACCMDFLVFFPSPFSRYDRFQVCLGLIKNTGLHRRMRHMIVQCFCVSLSPRPTNMARYVKGNAIAVQCQHGMRIIDQGAQSMLRKLPTWCSTIVAELCCRVILGCSDESWGLDLLRYLG